MCDSTIPVICFYNGKNEMIETDVKYVRNKVLLLCLWMYRLISHMISCYL